MKTTTRRLACTVAALSLSAPLFAQVPSPATPSTPTAQTARRNTGWAAMSWLESWQGRQGPETTERIVKTFKVGPNGSLDLATVSGDVIVNEGGGDTITIDAIKRVRSRSADDAKQQMANTNVSMAQSGNRVEVKVNYSGRRGGSVDFTVTAPAGTTLNVRSVSGDVRVRNIKGEVRLESVSGDVSATGTPNVALIKTVSGDLEQAGVSTQDNLDVSTISGDLTVRNIKARAINAESVSGEIVLNDVTCDRATVKSVSGDVQYSGPLARNGRYELGSHSGDVRITLPGDIGFDLEASTFSGDVRSDLPVTTRAGESLMGGSGRRHGLRGRHGDGSVFLVLNTFSGDITIARKQ
jgi:DUF4097 and DUF4098 domain-containing protein YvlB